MRSKPATVNCNIILERSLCHELTKQQKSGSLGRHFPKYSLPRVKMPATSRMATAKCELARAERSKTESNLLRRRKGRPTGASIPKAADAAKQQHSHSRALKDMKQLRSMSTHDLYLFRKEADRAESPAPPLPPWCQPQAAVEAAAALSAASNKVADSSNDDYSNSLTNTTNESENDDDDGESFAFALNSMNHHHHHRSKVVVGREFVSTHYLFKRFIYRGYLDMNNNSELAQKSKSESLSNALCLVHNETGNIYSHLIPGLICLIYLLLDVLQLYQFRKVCAKCHVHLPCCITCC